MDLNSKHLFTGHLDPYLTFLLFVLSSSVELRT